MSSRCLITLVVLTAGLAGPSGRAAAQQSETPALVRRLIERLGSEEPHVRQRAAEDLARLGLDAAPATDALLAALGAGDPALCVRAAEALGGIGKPAVPALIAGLGRDEVAVRLWSASALCKIGRDAEAAAPALARALADPSVDVRREAAVVLGEIGPRAAVAVPALAKALGEDADIAVRRQAARALAQLGEASAVAVPALVKALGARDDALRRHALTALTAIGPGAEPAMPVLISLLASSSSEVDAGQAIGALRSLGSPALSKVVELSTRGTVSRERLQRAFSAFGSLAVRASLLLLRQPSADLRWIAAETLSALAHDDGWLFDGMMAILVDPSASQEAKVAAADVLHARLQRPADEMLRALIEALRTAQRDEVRDAAALSLCELDSDAAVEAVRPFLARSRPLSLRLPVARSFVRAAFRRPSRVAVPALRVALIADDPEMRAAAARACAQLGPAAREARQQLLERLEDRDAKVRRWAARAIVRLGAQSLGDRDALFEVFCDERVEAETRVDAVWLLVEADAVSVETVASFAIETFLNWRADSYASARAFGILIALDRAITPSMLREVPALRSLADPTIARRHRIARAVEVTAARSEASQLPFEALAQTLGPEGWARLAWLLTRTGDATGEIVSVLADALGDDLDSATLRWLAIAIANAGSAGRVALPDLVGLLRHDDIDVRESALATIAPLSSPRTPEVAPAIARVLAGDEPALWADAATALERIGFLAVPALQRVLCEPLPLAARARLAAVIQRATAPPPAPERTDPGK